MCLETFAVAVSMMTVMESGDTSWAEGAGSATIGLRLTSLPTCNLLRQHERYTQGQP